MFWRRQNPHYPPSTYEPHCDNGEVCGGTPVYRKISPEGCRAILMAMNPVGYKLGQGYPCDSCGATVQQEAWPEDVSPAMRFISDPDACPYTDEA